MRVFERILRVTGWTAAAAIIVLAASYLAALAVNRSDQPPSSDARALAAGLDTPSDVPDEENGYVYVLGFAAPRGADPRRIGAERVEWIRRLRTDYGLARDSDPYPQPLSDVWKPERNDFFRRCPSRREERECFAVLSEARAEVEAWLAEQRWMLARYETLLRHSSWRAINTYDRRMIDPGLSSAADARNAWFLGAWARARAGDAAGVREALGADLEFWRLVLAEAGSLLSKAIAAGMVASHFERANTILRRLPADEVSGAVPASWRVPISREERSLRRAFAFELRYLHSELEYMRSSDGRYAAWAGVAPEPPSVLQRLNDRMGAALLQPQDYVNKTASQLTAIASALEAPYAQIPSALDAARALREPRGEHWAEPLYNVAGDGLRHEGTYDVYADAAARVADLEGVRRAALLTAELRSRGFGSREAAIAVAEADAMLTNPYADRPFGWDGEAGEIVFDGLRRRYAGRYTFWY